jgi:hypothetical protein
MEQYELPPQKCYDMLTWALKNFAAESVYIRLVGSRGGTVKVNEPLERKRLSIKRRRDGLQILINSKEVFLFKTTSIRKNSRISGKCWAIAYFRVDKQNRMHYASTGYPNLREPQYTGPDDPKLPEVKKTIFRAVNLDHLIEIVFSGKIPIKRTNILACGVKDWYYWEIDYRRTTART